MKDSGTKHMFKILVTRELSDSQIDYARSLGLEPVIEPALTISFRENWLSVETALKETPNPRFAFTSQNGVEALSRLLDIGITLPENPVMYSVGNKTAAALQKVGYKSSVPERSEEHTSELSHVAISYAVFCLKKKKHTHYST